ncbi:MAG: zinc-dependent metalloprotease [Bacteroidota bacterium]
MKNQFQHNVRMFLKLILSIVLLIIFSQSTYAEGIHVFQQQDSESSNEIKADTQATRSNVKIKPYSQVITKEAKSDSGVFIVHQVKSKFFLEIPFKELHKEFLFVNRLAMTLPALQASNRGYAGDEVNRRVICWERRENWILLREALLGITAADSTTISYAVVKGNQYPIIMMFDIQAFNKDSSSAVIDITKMFTNEEMGLTKRIQKELKLGGLDARRSFIDYVKSFPENIEMEATLTYKVTESLRGVNSNAATITMHHSMVLLPERPMMPRLYDDRVGYFFDRVIDYGYNSYKTEARDYIARWRLEPKDTAAFLRGELVEPIKPIVFYIDRAVPDKWKSWLKEGVEYWQVAFEKAGFKNAIVAQYAPTEQEDPDWSGEDARYSVIRWLPSTTANAYGPRITDPRTGEILDADLGIFHNIPNILERLYFTQVGNLNPKIRTLPLPDSLMGEILKSVATHEVGHSIGLRHNHKSSALYPVDSLRSKTFTSKYGITPSIMEYARFNYVAQPGDGAHLANNTIGPYDYFVIEWGYKPIIKARTSDDEKDELNKIAARQETEPYLRWEGDVGPVDPTVQKEDLGDDPVKATAYGLKNIKEIAGLLIGATTNEGENYKRLEEVFSSLIAQRNRTLDHVANYVGGIIQTKRVAGMPGVIYEPVPREKQKECVEFVVQEGFRTPTEILRPDILSLIGQHKVTEQVLKGHSNLLNTLLDNTRMARLINSSATSAPNVQLYSLAEMLDDLRHGVWKELQQLRKIKIDIYRRNLQREYIDIIESKLKPEGDQKEILAVMTVLQQLLGGTITVPGEARALLRAELMALETTLNKSLSRATDIETRAHIMDSRDRILSILYPEGKQ